MAENSTVIEFATTGGRSELSEEIKDYKVMGALAASFARLQSLHLVKWH